MTDRIERNARLLCRAEGFDADEMTSADRPGWRAYEGTARRLAAAGLTLVRIEPDEATVTVMVSAHQKARLWDYADGRECMRAAYRAAVGEG